MENEHTIELVAYASDFKRIAVKFVNIYDFKTVDDFLEIVERFNDEIKNLFNFSQMSVRISDFSFLDIQTITSHNEPDAYIWANEIVRIVDVVKNIFNTWPILEKVETEKFFSYVHRNSKKKQIEWIDFINNFYNTTTTSDDDFEYWYYETYLGIENEFILKNLRSFISTHQIVHEAPTDGYEIIEDGDVLHIFEI